MNYIILKMKHFRCINIQKLTAASLESVDHFRNLQADYQIED